MSVYIYNSLSRKKEELLPVSPPKLNIYTCGVTVYDESHIGHARSLYIFDVIRRYLEFKGFKVNFVRNITDIDDKIINRARELEKDWKDIVSEYISKYYQDLKALGIKKGDSEPRATENIPEMIKYIQVLIEKGYAYQSKGDVYFNVRKFPFYGRLSGQSIDQLENSVRIDRNEQKNDPLDFALWKESKEGEPFWESPWGRGRPGWHIECSVMSQRLLKTDTLDIHAGGRDLIFPHHENEIAQAEAFSGKPFAKYWIHHGLLTIDGQKMAKSAGNFVTIKNFLDKYHDADILKLFFLSAHYSQPIDYTENRIEEVKKSLERINIFVTRIHDSRYKNLAWAKKKIRELEDLKKRFLEAMDNDFNTPEALASVFDLVNIANKNIDNFDFAKNAECLLVFFSDILGVSLTRIDLQVDDGIERLIIQRNNARKQGDYKLSDKIRKELEEKGIILEDTKDGKTIWRKKL